MSRDPEPPLTPEEMVGVYVGSMRAPDVMRDLTTAGYTICGPDCGCSCLSASLPVGDDTPSLDAAHEALSAALYQPDKTHDDLVTAAMNVLAVAERSAQSRPKGTPGWLSEALNSGDGTYKP